jgi:hypothetical protein
MASIEWSKLFSTHYAVEGATDEEVQALVASLSTPVSDEEAAAINASQSNPFPASDPLHDSYLPFDARKWRPPEQPLPATYLSFLRFSNGGSFFNGDRRFDPFFPSDRIREYLLGYHVPQYMPGAVPFAFDGGGCFYLIDMRQAPVEGEYPILFVGSGNLQFDDAVLVATSFADACKGTTDPGERYMS